MRLRALADFDNYRKRVERERESAAQAGKRQLVMSLLEVMDNFERALDHTRESPEAVAEGLRAIYRRLLSVLEAEGITSFESVGESFDPALHEAIGTVASDQPSGRILDELSRGWRWGDQILRPARVRVAE